MSQQNELDSGLALAYEAILKLKTQVDQLRQDADANLEEAYEECYQEVLKEKERYRNLQEEIKGDTIDSVYLHISNGGVNFEVVNKKYGPVVRISSNQFGNNMISQEIFTTKKDLRKLGEMFFKAANEDFNLPYCHAATALPEKKSCCQSAQSNVGSEGASPNKKDDPGTTHPANKKDRISCCAAVKRGGSDEMTKTACDTVGPEDLYPKKYFK